MSDLTSQLNDISNANRLNTVESAYAGTAGSQTNFTGQWQGYDDKGQGLIKVNGKIYSASVLGLTSRPLNANVLLRVGKDIKTINW